MGFLEELRDFLRHPVIVPAETMQDYRRHFLATLERKEREGADAKDLGYLQHSLGRGLERFADFVSRELLIRGISVDETPELVKKAISLAAGAEEAIGSVTRALLVREITERIMKAENGPWAWFMFGSDPDHWCNIGRYALEIRATRARNGNAELTQIGRALLDLTGLDAVRWLLHLEAALSTGPEDAWRVAPSTLRMFAKVPRCVMSREDWSYEDEPLNWTTMRRLSALGILKIVDDPIAQEEGYEVLDHALPILKELTGGADSPMAVMVAALLQDDVQHRLPQGHMPSSAAATVRQARLVVHEVRNAIVPLKTNLNNIYRALRAAGIEDTVSKYRKRVDAGLEHMLSFAAELNETARLTGEDRTVFDVSAAMRDAISALDAEGPSPTLSLPEEIPPLLGIRSQFILALINLLRNAYQAAPGGIARLHVGVAVHTGRLQITVDDNGPGVRPDHRERIFADGYSTRPGGSGRGLALARATIEDEMGGTLTCEDGSSLGGARFVITLPPHNGRAA